MDGSVEIPCALLPMTLPAIDRSGYLENLRVVRQSAPSNGKLGEGSLVIEITVICDPCGGEMRLGTIGAEARAVEVLRADPSAWVRGQAARLLGRVGARAAVEALTTAAHRDPVPDVRAQAARALGDLGAPAAVPALRELLDDPRYRVAHEAAAALARLGSRGSVALREAAGVGGPGAAHAREAIGV